MPNPSNHGGPRFLRPTSFQRTVQLPDGATEDDVKATYKDGILEVRVPVVSAASKSPTRIAIEHGCTSAIGERQSCRA